jgi:hypothetical protein
MFKIVSTYICWKKYIKCNIWRVAVRPSYIYDARFLKVNNFLLLWQKNFLPVFNLVANTVLQRVVSSYFHTINIPCVWGIWLFAFLLLKLQNFSLEIDIDMCIVLLSPRTGKSIIIIVIIITLNIFILAIAPLFVLFVIPSCLFSMCFWIFMDGYLMYFLSCFCAVSTFEPHGCCTLSIINNKELNLPYLYYQ